MSWKAAAAAEWNILFQRANKDILQWVKNVKSKFCCLFMLPYKALEWCVVLWVVSVIPSVLIGVCLVGILGHQQQNPSQWVGQGWFLQCLIPPGRSFTHGWPCLGFACEDQIIQNRTGITLALYHVKKWRWDVCSTVVCRKVLFITHEVQQI